MLDSMTLLHRTKRGRAGKDKISPSSTPGGQGKRVDMVMSEPVCGHTLLNFVIADPTRVDMVARAAIAPEHAASQAPR